MDVFPSAGATCQPSGSRRAPSWQRGVGDASAGGTFAREAYSKPAYTIVFVMLMSRGRGSVAGEQRHDNLDEAVPTRSNGEESCCGHTLTWLADKHTPATVTAGCYTVTLLSPVGFSGQLVWSTTILGEPRVEGQPICPGKWFACNGVWVGE